MVECCGFPMARTPRSFNALSRGCYRLSRRLGLTMRPYLLWLILVGLPLLLWAALLSALVLVVRLEYLRW